MKICPYAKHSAWSNTCNVDPNNPQNIEDPFYRYCGFSHGSDGNYTECPHFMQLHPKKDDGGGCYLTTACMQVQADEFDDNCAELTTLRKFRDSYVEKNHNTGISKYYDVAPRIVEEINKLDNSSEIFTKMYNDLVVVSCELISNEEYEKAYNHYKAYSLDLENKYL